MADFSHLSDEELEKIANPNYSNYSDYELKKLAGEEPTISEDISHSFSNFPEYASNLARQLPGELEGAYHMPLGRSLKNIGQGLENLVTLPIDLGSQITDYLAKKHIPYLQRLAEYYPHIPKHDLFGLGKQQPGDLLFQSAIPFGGLAKLTKGLSLVKGAATRAAGASLYGAAQGENPIESFLTGTALEGLTHGLTSIPRAASNLNERVNSGLSNYYINKANKGLETGETLTPEQATRNSLEQFTNIERQPMGVDFGTLTGNKTIQDIYNVGRKIPFSEGRQQVAKVDKQLYDKREELARIEHEKESGVLTKEQQSYEQKLRNSISELEKHQDIQQRLIPQIENQIMQNTPIYKEQLGAIEEAPSNIEALRHPQINHNQLIKSEVVNNFESGKQQVDEAYAPFNGLDADLNTIKMPNTFNSKYKEAYDEVKEQSEDLIEAFHDDRDLGKQVSSEIKKADAFFNPRSTEKTGHGQEVRTVADIFKFKKATPAAITTHIRNLQSLAEEAFAAGKHRQAALLNKMASGLKSDMKEILTQGGYQDAVSALEVGDSMFKEKVLPYYKNREVKKLATDKLHHLTDTSRVSLSNALHQPNLERVLNNFSPEAKNATIYELITRGKYGKTGHGLTPKEIASLYKTHIKSNARESIERSNPQISNYLENLEPMMRENEQLSSHLGELTKNKESLLKTSNKGIEKHEADIEKAKESGAAIEEKLKSSKKKFQDVMLERFGIAKPRSSGAWQNIKKATSPFAAASLGTSAYFLNSFSVPHIVEALGITIPLAKKINRILTETKEGSPILLKHYVEGTKVKPNLKKPSNLAKNIQSGLGSLKMNPNNGEKKRT